MLNCPNVYPDDFMNAYPNSERILNVEKNIQNKK